VVALEAVVPVYREVLAVTMQIVATLLCGPQFVIFPDNSLFPPMASQCGKSSGRYSKCIVS